MPFPTDRPRRLRRTEAMRSFVRETRLSPEGFVYPLFVCPGEGVRKEVRSMPGVFNLSVDEVVKECAEVKSLGIPSVILFGLPESKDEVATDAWSDDGIVQKAARAIKREVTGLPFRSSVQSPPSSASVLPDAKEGSAAATPPGRGPTTTTFASEGPSTSGKRTESFSAVAPEIG